jgi:ABC-type transport system involved in multi-copper enzyme maturation permease subunit
VKALLWKDYRLNRVLMLLGVVGMAGVYVAGLAVEVGYAWPALPAAESWAGAICSYGHLALSVVSYVAALLGGNAIACERSDRSAHFLAYLPPTKTQILASKFLVAAGALAVLWGANCLAVYAIAPLISPDPMNFLHMFGSPSASLAGCVATFGVGWLGSAFLAQPTFPVLTALALPFVLGYGLFTFAELSGISRFEVFEWAGTVSALTGVAAFMAGTRSYYLRVEP